MRYVLSILIALLTLNCGGASDTLNGQFKLQNTGDTFQQNGYTIDTFTKGGVGAKVTFLFVMDNSRSMKDLQGKVVNASPAIFDGIDAQLSDADVRLGTITTNTFRSGIGYIGDVSKYNPNATSDEKNWEMDCKDPISSNFNTNLCANNWWDNGTLGRLPTSDPQLGGISYITGQEYNREELLKTLNKRGYAGHWLESPAWAIMQFLGDPGVDQPMKDPRSFLSIIVITDSEDASHATDKKCYGLCGDHHDSRNTVAESSNPENFAFYNNLEQQFLSALIAYKPAPMLSLNLIGSIAPLPSGCDVEHVEHRMHGVIKKLQAVYGVEGVTGNICKTASLPQYFSDSAAVAGARVSKLFPLSHEPVSEIIASTVEVTLDGAMQTEGVHYQYLEQQGIVSLFNSLPPGSTLKVKYFAARTRFQLSKKAEPDSVHVFFGNVGNQVEVPMSDWHYDATDNSVVFEAPELAGDPGETIQINYQTNITGNGGFDPTGNGGNDDDDDDDTTTNTGSAVNAGQAGGFHGSGGCGSMATRAAPSAPIFLWLFALTIILMMRRRDF